MGGAPVFGRAGRFETVVPGGGLLSERPPLSLSQQIKPRWWCRSIQLGAWYPRGAPTPCGARSVGPHPTTSTGLVKMGGHCPAAPSSGIKVRVAPGPSATTVEGETQACPCPTEIDPVGTHTQAWVRKGLHLH